jgi:hypothetical protein
MLETRRVPVARFLDVVSDRFAGSWEVREVKAPSQDPSKSYLLRSRDAMIVLSAIPHDRCDFNAPMHTTFDPAYRVDFIYLTEERAKREAAKQKLFEAASEIGERLTKFNECRSDRPHASARRR